MMNFVSIRVKCVMARVKKSSTNLEIKLHHLEKNASRKLVKEPKYDTKKHYMEQFQQFVDEESEDNHNYIFDREAFTDWDDDNFTEWVLQRWAEEDLQRGEVEPYHPGLK